MARTPDKPGSPPFAVGEPVPCAAQALGVHVKLARYSLDPTNEVATSKVRGFEQILGITLEDIDYLEGAIYTGVQLGWVGN